VPKDKKEWYECVTDRWGTLGLPRGSVPLGFHEAEVLYFARILQHAKGNKSEAARLAKLDRRTLQRKIPRLRRLARKMR
jgi:DNA-binding NtrC family response regulator